jgi:hypothetical protein
MEIRPRFQGDHQIIHYFNFIGFSALRAELAKDHSGACSKKSLQTPKNHLIPLEKVDYCDCFLDRGKTDAK